MPCYQVNTVSTVFNSKHEALLLAAIKELGWSVADWRNSSNSSNASWRDYIEVNYGGSLSAKGSFLLDLEKGVAKFAPGSQGQEKLNELKRKYAEKTIEQIAKQKRWSIKKRGNQIELARY